MLNRKLLISINDTTMFKPELFRSNNVGIEVQSFPQDILDEDYRYLINEYRNKLKDFNCIVSLHGASFDLNPGSMDRKIIDITKYRYLQSIKIAETIGASYVVFHSQLNPILKAPKIRLMKIDNQIKFWKCFLKEIVKNNITILLENEYDDNYKELLYIIEGVNSPRLKVCLDIGHALAYSDLELEDWILGLNKNIEYIHLHWNDGINDLHNSPKNEDLELVDKLIKKAGINPIIALEYGIGRFEEEIRRIRKMLTSLK